MVHNRTTLCLVRHGETEYTIRGRFCGWADIPLNDKGFEQARNVVQLCGVAPADALFVSPLRRARQTAEVAFGGLVPVVTEDLREISFGEWEGLTHKELLDRDAVRYQRWLNDPVGAEIPGGENILEFEKRVLSFFRAVLRDRAGKKIAFVTHGGPIRIILCHTLGSGLRDIWKTMVGPGSVSCLEFDGETLIR